MTIQLLAVRHGNTFAPGDKVVWVGRGEDLPLVESGRAQAEALEETLRHAGWTPDTAVSGGLVRQTEHLSIAAGEAVPQFETARLDEVDYGPWGGLSTAEIEERFGPDEITAWNERSQWPVAASWPETREQVAGRVAEFAREVASGSMGQRVLVCTSNGILRWLLDLIPGALETAVADGTFKVRTGAAGLLEYAPDGAWSLRCWNLRPAELAEFFESR